MRASLSVDASAARTAPGVIAVVTGAELAKVCTPWIGVLSHLKGLKSAPQHAIALDRACWQGEAVAAVVARTRAAAEDAAEQVEVAYEELEPVTDMATALDAGTPVIHPELGDNLAFERHLDAGEVDRAFAEADAVVEASFGFGRHTGVTLEPRAMVADWNPGEARLTVYQGTQAPHMMQNIIAKHLGLAEAQVRVVCKDVGGSFGIKVHVYADEMATAALSKLLRRPVKYVADRLESFVTDIHARDHVVQGRIAVMKDGRIGAFAIDDLTGIGPYSMYPRTSAIEANQIVNLVGGPYTCRNYRARARVVFQNKNVMCQYRAVGHPIACSVTEGLVDLAAQAIGMDPVEIRRRNLIRDDAHPSDSASGLKFEALSHHASLDKLVAMMGYDALRAEQAALRQKGVHRGIGFASFIEVTNPSAAFYGVGGARISSQDGATVRLDATGTVVCQTSVTEQGQGTEAIIAQVVATAFGVPLERVRVILGDTDVTPYGGGTWASRAAGIGGEAALQAGKALRESVVAVAGAILQAAPKSLDIRDGAIVDADTGRERMPLEELARIAYFRPDTLPAGVSPEFVATRHFVPKKYPFAFTNGIQASYLEVDVRHRLRPAPPALGGRGLRHDHQPAARRRADPRRRRAGPRPGAVRALPLRRARPAPQRLNDGLPRADGARDARHRGRPRGFADGGIGARRQGGRGGGNGRRGGGGDERRQRRARAARDAHHRHPDHAGAGLKGAREGVARFVLSRVQAGGEDRAK